MTAELAKLRKVFVGKVSKDVIKQLLDDLEDEKILNSGEVEAIIEENPRTTDKARKLIDNVKNKGEKASNRLIHHLQNRDATLFENLCQECGLAVKPAQESLQRGVQEQGSLEQQTVDQHDGASGLNKSNNSNNSKDIYPVTSNSVKNRVALLITNITFKNLTDRLGAEKDEENMDKLLSELGYEVVKNKNFTAKQMDEALVEFSQHPKLKATDSVFVVIMSHGKRGAVLGVNYTDEDPDELPIDNIYSHLNAKNCPALVDKPKIIVIQACRGDQKGAVIMSDSVETDDLAGGDIEDDVLRFIHKEKDFIALLSCTPDTLSYRDRSKGSFLIQFMVKVFNSFAREDGIEELFRKVMREFEEDKELPNRFKQMASKDRCTLTRLFYLFPGLSEAST